MSDDRPRTVGILVFEEVEVLDFCGPFEVFASAQDPQTGERAFDVSIVAETTGIVSCRGGLLVKPHTDFSNAPQFDLIVAPGGYGTRAQKDNPALIDWIGRQHHGTEITISVCTGLYLLAAAGLVDELPVTTHWAAFDEAREFFPDLQLVSDQRVIDTGNVVTSAGVSAGIDMALAMVERLLGRTAAEETARDMEYDWQTRI
ncbi:MAG: DJ-1/PfpI family protein [Thermomicrobiales bacterium]|nr:DJ-1/PfpI family protein [Thermomicrobiales bacterium]MCO5223334.1 DJ-1/PfpI family protein [Thermomicrobiales bacterium]